MNNISPIYPFFTNAIFAHFSCKAEGTERVISIIRNIIKDTVFQSDPKGYFLNWKNDNPFHRSINCGLYGFKPEVSIVIKNIERYMYGDKDILTKLETKVAVLREADRLLKEVQSESTKRAVEYTPTDLIAYCDRLASKEEQSPAEEKIIKTVGKVFSQY